MNANVDYPSFSIGAPSTLPPSGAAMEAANVHPESWLATDFLNPFNEYIMLAEMVAGGTMEADVLEDWVPVDYEMHFTQSGFAGTEVVLAAFRALPDAALVQFEARVSALEAAIFAHRAAPDNTFYGLAEVHEARDHLAAYILDGSREEEASADRTQSTIDALFD